MLRIGGNPSVVLEWFQGQGASDVSGPIVRKYGFPNFEQIFGKRELEHGVDDDSPAASQGGETPNPAGEEAAAGQGNTPEPKPTHRKK
jgi:hypothetical protein